MVQYQLPSGVMELSEVFGHIESSYEALHIEDYSVSQTTLDNVRPICSFYFKLIGKFARKTTNNRWKTKLKIFLGPENSSRVLI